MTVPLMEEVDMRGSPYASTPKALSELNQSRIVQYLLDDA